MRRLIGIAAVLAAAGCIFVTEPWSLGDDTPIQSWGPGGDYPKGNFGDRLVGAVFDVDGTPRGYLASSAAARSPTQVLDFPVEPGTILNPGKSYEVCMPLGHLLEDGAADETCNNAGTGESLLWIPRFYAAGQTRSPCLVVGETMADGVAEDLGRISVHCRSTTGFAWAGKVNSPGTAGFGRTVALLHSNGAERLVVTALVPPPEIGTRLVGEVYVSRGSAGDATVPSSGVWTTENELLLADASRVDGYGADVAAGVTADGRGWVAVAAISPSDLEPSRIYFFRPVDADPRGPLAVAACVEAVAGVPLGAGMLAADLDGDGNDELIARAVDGLSVYGGAALSALAPLDVPYAPSACSAFDATAGAPPQWAAVPCEEDTDRDVVCSSTFGKAIGTGDIDGDGVDEMLVGDPSARVRGVDRAGTVHVYEVDGATPAFTRVATVADASPETGQLLGSTITLVGPSTRVEPFVGAPGTGEVFQFRCTGIEGDRPNRDGLDARCRAR